MAAVTGKRKREEASMKTKVSKKPASKEAVNGKQKSASKPKGPQYEQPKAAISSTPATSGKQNGSIPEGPLHVQIVTGSYERVLHGIAARIPRSKLDREPKTSNDDSATKIESSSDSDVTFSDSFLFAAHSSAIRCLAISQVTDDSDKCLLATGSSDERINVYSLSTTPRPINAAKQQPNLPSLTGTATAENPRNKSLGSLIHHDRAITRLHFPAKSKLFSAAEDATIAISRTRDWTVLSSIKAPIPKPQGRPSGDTAGPGEIPAGVNDFAIHPSQKVMFSVGRGERCVRAWNLMTGKKASVLNFDRELLAQAGEGKFASGEGRRVLWDESGENYVVGFERGAAFFGINSEPKAIIKTSPPSKIHEMRFLTLPSSDGSVLALSTEDGRVSFFSMDVIGKGEDGRLPLVPCIAQLGGRNAGITGRVKDFEILRVPHAEEEPGQSADWIVLTGSSDGAVRLWTLFEDDVAVGMAGAEEPPKQVGCLIATHETGNRITCLGGFVMCGQISEEAEEQVVGAEQEEEEEDSEDSDE